MKKILYLTILLLLSSFMYQAQATHMMGSDIGWECVGKDSFLVKLTIYRDCNGVNLSSASIPFKDVTTGKSVVTISIPLPTPIDATPSCGASCTRCESSACTFPYGIEKYEFIKLVDLSAYSACEYILSYAMCCRNTTITTGAASQNFYIEAYMNKCVLPGSSSPEFLTMPIRLICIGQDLIFNQGAIDIDVNDTALASDSIKFALAEPLTSASNAAPYTSPYTYQKPLYYLGFPNDNLTFPKGFHFDESTGEIMFRPTKLEQTVFAIEVTEYKNGKIISKIRRDIQIIVTSCPTNKPPELIANDYMAAFPGDTVVFKIECQDSNSLDSVKLFPHYNLPGAIWVDSNTNSKYPTGYLIWVPDVQDIRNYPYLFTVEARDNACPLYGKRAKTFKIFVQGGPEVKSQAPENICYGAKADLQSNISNARTPVTYYWSSGDVTNSGYLLTGPLYKDTTFYVHAIDAAGFNIYDTFNIKVNQEIKYNISGDTVCSGEAADLSIVNKTPSTLYFTWYDQSKIYGSSSMIKVQSDNSQEYFIAILMNENGIQCMAYDTVWVEVLDLPDTTLFVSNDTLYAKSVVKNYSWYKNSNLLKSGSENWVLIERPATYYAILSDKCESQSSDYVFNAVSLENEMFENSIKLYPNPSTDHVVLELNDHTTSISEILVTDLNSKVVKGVVYDEKDPSSYLIDVGSLSRGQYIISIITEKGIAKRLFVKI